MTTYNNIDIRRIFNTPANLATITIDGQFCFDTTNKRIGAKDLSGVMYYSGTGTYVNVDGSEPMTADWDFGGYDLTNVGVLDVDSVTISDNLKLVNTIDEFSTDGTLAGDSDDAVPTEKAVKTYVDAQVSSEDHWDRNAGSGYLYQATITDRLGVGTTSPSAKLQINNSDDITSLDIEGAQTTQRTAYIHTNSAQSGDCLRVLMSGAGSSGEALTARNDGSGAIFSCYDGDYGDAFNVFTVADGGKIGLSTTTPTEKLTIFDGNLTLYNSSDTEYTTIKRVGVDDWEFEAGGSLKIECTTSGTLELNTSNGTIQAISGTQGILMDPGSGIMVVDGDIHFPSSGTITSTDQLNLSATNEIDISNYGNTKHITINAPGVGSDIVLDAQNVIELKTQVNVTGDASIEGGGSPLVIGTLNDGVNMFPTASSGRTPELNISGYPSGGSLHTVTVSLDSSTDDMAVIGGVSTIKLDGDIVVSGEVSGDLNVDGGVTCTSLSVTDIAAGGNVTITGFATLEDELRITGDIDVGSGYTSLALARASQMDVSGKSYVLLDGSGSSGALYYSFSNVSEGQTLFVTNPNSCHNAYIDADPINQVLSDIVSVGSQGGKVTTYINGQFWACS